MGSDETVSERGVYLLVAAQTVVGQDGTVVQQVRCVVHKSRSVFYLQDLDAVSDHRRHAELTQLGRERRHVKLVKKEYIYNKLIILRSQYVNV